MPENKPTMTVAEKKRLFALFARHINRNQIRFLSAGHLDILETERQGVSFTDPVSGKRVFDCLSSAGCFNASRHNPEVMEVLAQAVDELDMGTSGLSSPDKQSLAARLAAITPGDLDGVLFAAGGGEAVDCAIKLARGATGRSQIVSTIKAYHGHTGFALSANGKEYYRRYFEPLVPGFTFVPFNDLEAMEKVVSASTAAVMVEPVQGEAGIFPASTAYLKGLRELCDRHGAILIFDEIQTGFGRTGKMFACEHSQVVPDLMTVSKSLCSGLYANAALLYRPIPVLVNFMEAHPDFHETFGGTDIACRVSMKVIDYLIAHQLCENAARQGETLKNALTTLMRENPKIILEVRGLGLMVGLEYVEEFMGPMMSDALARHGVFAAYSGNAPQVMRFMVPITVTDEEMEQIIAAIRNAVTDMKRLLPFALLASRIPGVLKLLNNEKVQVSLFYLLRKVEDVFKPAKGATT